MANSFEKNYFITTKYATVDSNLKIIEDMNIIPCAIFFNTHMIPIRFTLRNKNVTYGLNWFNKNNFQKEDISRIKIKSDEILKLPNLKKEILNILHSQKQQFGEGRFYQSFEDLRISGQRPTYERFKKYGIEKYLNKSSWVLDIGCNVGFFSLYVSKYVKRVDGLETNSELFKIGTLVKDYLKIKNCYFFNSDFKKHNFSHKYDIILSFAVHNWIGLPLDEYARKLYLLLNSNGFVLFESHDIKDTKYDFDRELNIFKNIGFKVEYIGDICDDGLLKRRYALLGKNR